MLTTMNPFRSKRALDLKLLKSGMLRVTPERIKIAVKNGLRVLAGGIGLLGAAMGLIACFSPIDWPMGALFVLVGATIFSNAAGALHKNLYLFLIPSISLATYNPVLIIVPLVVLKFLDRHYRSKPIEPGSR